MVRGTDPRTARTNERLRASVLDGLARRGYRGLTIEQVAADSGVAKTTIYRRWASKAEMVFDLALRQGGDLPDVGDTGSLRGDVQSLVDRMLAFVGAEPGRSVLPGLFGDMAGDPALAARFRTTFVVGARPLFGAVLARAVERGELPSADGLVDLQAMLLGAALAWVHVMPEGIAADLRDRLVEQVLAALGSASGSAR
jgi:AcrR family transcriptional regulator